MEDAPYALVAVDGLPLAGDRHYTYAVPAQWRGRLRPGQAVLVPFGPRNGVGGWVVALSDHAPPGEAKAIESVIDGAPLPEDLQATLAWVAEETFTPHWAVWQAALPAGVLDRVRRDLHLVATPEAFEAATLGARGAEARLAELLREHAGCVPMAKLKSAVKQSGVVISRWRQAGLVRVRAVWEPPAKAQGRLVRRVLAKPEGADLPLTPRQQEVWASLVAAGGRATAAALKRWAHTTDAVLKGLEKQGAVRFEEGPPEGAEGPVGGAGEGFGASAEAPPPTPAQAEAIARLEGALATGHASFLLEGVTGSGKTEVYLAAIAACLASERQAIVLVPEIALTPQAVARFRARFGDQVAVLHSALGPAERLAEWKRLRSGEATVAVGARSAIFAPLPRLGLIVVDEEHDGAYKQDNQPRYHARRVAFYRARRAGAVLVLGSATPSVEAHVAVQKGQVERLSLPARVGDRPLPPVRVIDLRAERADGRYGLLSRQLHGAMEKALAAGEQSILLINRRGWGNGLFCRSCGQSVHCQRCDVAMTPHQDPERLVCHYCEAQSPIPLRCPHCHAHELKALGVGTQQVHDAVLRAFPEARVARMDRDTMAKKGAHAELLGAFGRGELDVLVGTQMVAKGLDFPKVTVVGVVAVEGALHLPDFRASERAFQLLTQVAGRAGRADLPGQVIVQCFSPEHPAVKLAAEHDVAGFLAEEAEQRAELGWPPFARLAVLTLQAPQLELAMAGGAAAAEALKAADLPGLEAFGPQAAPIPRLRGLHRVQVVVRAPRGCAWKAAWRQALAAASRPGLQVALDVDPQAML